MAVILVTHVGIGLMLEEAAAVADKQVTRYMAESTLEADDIVSMTTSITASSATMQYSYVVSLLHRERDRPS